MKNTSSQNQPASKPFEVVFKRVLNLRNHSMETMAFVFYKN